MNTEVILIRVSPKAVFSYDIENGHFHRENPYSEVTDYSYSSEFKHHKRANDLSNFVKIERVYQLENTDKAQAEIAQLARRLHLTDFSVIEGPLERPEFVADYRPSSPTAYLDFFLQKWHRGCSPLYSEEELQEGENHIKNLRHTHPSYGELNEYEYIAKMLSMLDSNQTQLFPCEAGVHSFQVNGDGALFRCNRYAKAGLEKSSDEIGCIDSVDDLAPCKSCFSRYMCGGRCNLLINQLQSNACVLFREFTIVLLKAIISHHLAEKSAGILVKE
ncbi:hypothetical protein MKY98_05185 [Paenibacillus sp. FSL M8-0228]|jgi:radical SAM protein with 4Fe4S-binding SPASM domain|uniref:hypothetical protein n=1 Tax=Paenibacillus TaxID=44249 RepID=UPI0004032D6F|nr:MULTISPECIES: hypothetical protein [Paenibacillus]MBO3283409.1 hypothetical protein [Paenibacillus polymyxa]ODB53513.1 hypothetical protein A7311_23490 [Paenibacillus polymyxa]UMY55852.1 hypothetical protein MLD56_05160 [Paenibacillus peoriae]